MMEYIQLMQTVRADLFRLLGDEDRLRLLALCAEEELTVGELALLLDESQPQITEKTQPLRGVGLLASRRDGTRTLLKADLQTDVVVDAAVTEGRRLCSKDGSLAKVARVVAQREELSKKLFDAHAPEAPAPALDSQLVGWLPILAPLLPGRALAIDAGTGEGALLPLLAPLYERVLAVDRSAARLARCGARLEHWGLANVRLREGSIEDAALAEEVLGPASQARDRGADLVVIARVLHFLGRPQDAIAAATRLLRPGGHLALIDYVPHDDETLREQGHVWLGFEPEKLTHWLATANLTPVITQPLPTPHHPPLQLAIGRKPARATA
ncbi:metalloregulator ArsR/SmtB family transcription factor [soil metagenome]